MTRTTVLSVLGSHGIDYDLYEHAPFFTVEDALQHSRDIPGSHTKNLFLTSKKKTDGYLVSVHWEARLDIKAFATHYDLPRLSFARDEMLEQHLGVRPGSVGVFGLLHETDLPRQLYIDPVLWEADRIGRHPNDNTATIMIDRAGVRRLCELMGRDPVILDEAVLTRG